MPEKACRECYSLTPTTTCPRCKTANLSDDFSGLVIIIDPSESEIAMAMQIKQKGRYALRVR
jgi:DNA-directed RNA polymerase subunit E"